MTPPVATTHAPNARQAYLSPRSSGARLHAGIDLAAPRGTLVAAPEKASVVRAYADADSAPATGGWAWSGYGPAVVLLHGISGAYHVLAHLEDLQVNAGDVVGEGDVVGRVSALAHCHWEVRSMPYPPHGASVVETTTDPARWLAGAPALYTAADGCPPSPGTDYRTPWSCRPGNAGAPPFHVLPFRKAR